MEKKAKIYLILPPGSDGPVSDGLFTRARLNYKVGADFRLYRAADMTEPNRGLMAVSFTQPAAAASAVPLADEIMRECIRKNFEGVLLDASGNSRPLVTLVSALVPAMRKHGMKLYMPANAAPGMTATRIITAAPDEGDLRTLLGNIRNRYRGGFGIYAAVRRENVDLSSGKEQRLTHAGMESLIKRLSPRFYYSDELMAEYAAVCDGSGDGDCMLLRDTGESMARRVHAAEKYGAEAVFLVWQEMQPFWLEFEKNMRG